MATGTGWSERNWLPTEDAGCPPAGFGNSAKRCACETEKPGQHTQASWPVFLRNPVLLLALWAVLSAEADNEGVKYIEDPKKGSVVNVLKNHEPARELPFYLVSLMRVYLNLISQMNAICILNALAQFQTGKLHCFTQAQ